MTKLVLDVGMFDGSDTAEYLRQGYHVVAIEANPVNVELARKRFPAALMKGRLRIINCAVAAREGIVRLNVPVGSPAGGTTSREHMQTSVIGRTAVFEYIDVPGRTFRSILDEVGTPYYIKVDIEGADMLCAKALLDLPRLPEFFSMESRVGYQGAAAFLAELRTLYRAGYRRFAYVNQRWNPPLTSGPFGDCLDATWLSVAQARYHGAQLHAANRWRENTGRPLRSWYDLHARL